MTYRVEFTTAAARQVRTLPQPLRRRIFEAIEKLAEESRPNGARKLVGEKVAWRRRLGDYRVIYEVIDAQLLVTVVRAAHRWEVDDR